jgi:hypothetical protein
MSKNKLIVAAHKLNISLIGYSLGLSNDEFSIDLIDYPSVRQLLINHPELMQICINGFNDAKTIKEN